MQFVQFCWGGGGVLFFFPSCKFFYHLFSWRTRSVIFSRTTPTFFVVLLLGRLGVTAWTTIQTHNTWSPGPMFSSVCVCVRERERECVCVCVWLALSWRKTYRRQVGWGPDPFPAWSYDYNMKSSTDSSHAGFKLAPFSSDSHLTSNLICNEKHLMIIKAFLLSQLMPCTSMYSIWPNKLRPHSKDNNKYRIVFFIHVIIL